MGTNFDNIKEVKLLLKKEENKLLRLKIKIEQLKKVIEAHDKGIFNPKLFVELMRRSKEV